MARTTSDRGAVTFALLGPVEATVGGKRVDLGGLKQRAILALLLIEAGRTVSTERIIDALWPDDPPPSAVGTIQGYISHLRRALEPNRARGAAPTVLVTRGNGYTLEADAERIDASRFTRLLEQARTAVASGDHLAAIAALDEGLALWRGDALAEFAGEPFAQPEAFRLDELRLAARELRAEAVLEAHGPDAAIPELEALVNVEPLRERPRALLMLALYRAGRQAAALRVYREGRDLLAEQLGIDPGPALRQLEADILAQSPALDAAAPHQQPAPAARAVPSRAAVPVPGDELRCGTTLVGREAEMGQLARAVEQAVGGRGRVVLIYGEPGIGKTRLAEEAACMAEQAGMRVVWGRCLEDGAPPFWPWMQVLRAFEGCTNQALQLDLLSENPHASRVSLYDDITRGFVSHAQDFEPLALILEDLQWGDVPSLELTRYVAAAARDRRMLILCTYRDTDLAPDHPLLDLLGGLAREAVSERVAARGLDEGAVARFVETAADCGPHADFVATLHRRTAGNPFFLSELVRLLHAEGLLDGHVAPGAVQAARVPDAVGDVIERRVARLPAVVRPVLEAAAVLGREFELRVLEGTAGVPRDVMLDALDAAASTRLVEAGDTPGRYRFAHDLVRETMYERLSPVARARLHARAAETVAALGADTDRTAELARHAWCGVDVYGPDRAMPVLVAAADQAWLGLAYEQAETLLERALSLAKSGSVGDARHHELHAAARLGRLRSTRLGYAADETLRCFLRADELAGSDGHGSERLWTLFGLWAYRCVRADFAGAIEHAHALLQTAERLQDPVFEAAGRQAAGTTHLHMGSVEAAESHLRRGIAVADALPERLDMLQQDPVVACRAFLAVTLAHQGQMDEASALSREAIALALPSTPFNEAFAHFFDAWVGLLDDDPKRVLEQTATATAIADRHGFGFWRAIAGVLGGWADGVLGDAAAGERRIRESLRALDASGTFMLRPFFLGLLADVLRRDGRAAEAADTVERAIATAEQSGELFYLPRLEEMRAEV